MAREYKDLKQEKSFAARIGIKQTVKIPIEEMDLKIREDRIGRYFKKYLNKFVFAEFSEDFLSTFKAADIMRGVPIPLRKQDIKEFNGGSGLSMLHIAENMAVTLTSNIHRVMLTVWTDSMAGKSAKVCSKKAEMQRSSRTTTMPAYISEHRSACSLTICTQCIHMRESAE